MESNFFRPGEVVNLGFLVSPLESTMAQIDSVIIKAEELDRRDTWEGTDWGTDVIVYEGPSLQEIKDASQVKFVDVFPGRKRDR